MPGMQLETITGVEEHADTGLSPPGQHSELLRVVRRDADGQLRCDAVDEKRTLEA